jgi:hypothetical protein
MKTFSVVNDSSDREASAIKVIDGDGRTLVAIKGPMSMATAGAFIQALEDDKPGLIALAHTRWLDN